MSLSLSHYTLLCLSLSPAVPYTTLFRSMFYDAVYHMRIMPSHLLREVPRSQWRTAVFGRAPVGDGPYRFVATGARSEEQRLNSSHVAISYAVFCLKKKSKNKTAHSHHHQ